MRLLDVGCGWGGMVRARGASTTACARSASRCRTTKPSTRATRPSAPGSTIGSRSACRTTATSPTGRSTRSARSACSSTSVWRSSTSTSRSSAGSCDPGAACSTTASAGDRGRVARSCAGVASSTGTCSPTASCTRSATWCRACSNRGSKCATSKVCASTTRSTLREWVANLEARLGRSVAAGRPGRAAFGGCTWRRRPSTSRPAACRSIRCSRCPATKHVRACRAGPTGTRRALEHAGWTRSGDGSAHRLTAYDAPCLSRPTRPLVVARAIRAFADGFAAVLLARYLQALGFSNTQIGVLITATLLGSAVLTLWAGLRLNRWGAQKVLFASCGLMALTGVGFASVTRYWPLLVVAFLGTLESVRWRRQLVPAHRAGGHRRLHAAAGASAPVRDLQPLRRVRGRRRRAGVGGAGTDRRCARLGRRDGDAVLVSHLRGHGGRRRVRLPRPAHARAPRRPNRRGLHKSRDIVIRLSALFTLDSAGGGFVVTSLLVLYLDVRFDLSPGATGATLAAAGTLTAFSQLLSPRLANRIGLVHTMVFTHLPANVFLILAGIVPNAAARDHVLAHPRRALANGRARASIVGDARRGGRRTRRGGQRHERAPQLGLRDSRRPLQGSCFSTRSFGWPLDGRRCDEGRVRLAVVAPTNRPQLISGVTFSRADDPG